MKTIDNETGTDRTIEYGNFDEFLHEVITTPPLKGNNNHSLSSTATQRWDMGAGYDGAKRLADNGWAEGLATLGQVRSLVDIPDQSDRSIQPQPVWSDEGDEVDIDRYLDGETECMIRFTPEVTPSYGRVAKVLVNLAASAGVDSATQYRRGAAACILIDALEGAGVRCEVWCLPFCGRSGDNNFTAKVLVKKPDEHVEPDRLAFMLAHPAVMRRLGFRLLEQQPAPWGKWTKGGYGSPVNCSRSEQEEDGTIYFGAHAEAFETEESMVKAVNRLLAKYVDTGEGE